MNCGESIDGSAVMPEVTASCSRVWYCCCCSSWPAAFAAAVARLTAEVPSDRQLVGRALRAAHRGADAREHRLDLGVDRGDRPVEEGARPVDDLGRPVLLELGARAAGAAVGSVRAGERERPERRARHRVLTGEARLELGQGGQILGLHQVGQRLVDQHDHRVLAEVPLVGDGRLIAGRGLGDEGVDPGRRLERQRQQRAAQRRARRRSRASPAAVAMRRRRAARTSLRLSF